MGGDFDICAGCGKRILLGAPEGKCARCRGVRDDGAVPVTVAVCDRDPTDEHDPRRQHTADPRGRHGRDTRERRPL